MPNIVAHSHITSTILGDWRPEAHLGSTLPDFASMYEARYGGFVAIRGISRGLDAGVDFHLRTDSVFDGQPQKPEITQPLAYDLEAAGLPNGAARLSASFAADVLLDRALLDHSKALTAYRTLGGSILGGATALDGPFFDSGFARYVHRYFRDDVPRYYDDPRHIAAIIQHRLGVRSDNPNRTISNEQIPVLADVIGLHADRAGELGLAAMAQTIETLAA